MEKNLEPFAPDAGITSPFCRRMSNVLPEIIGVKPKQRISVKPVRRLTNSGAFDVPVDPSSTDFIVSIGGKNLVVYQGVVKSVASDGRTVTENTNSAITTSFISNTIFGDHAYAVNGVDKVVKIDSGTEDATEIANSPIAKAIGTIEAFVVVGNTSEDPRLIHWCNTRQPEVWTASQTNRAGFLTLDGCNEVRQIINLGRDGLVGCDNQVYRFSFKGGGTPFKPVVLLQDVGIVGPNAMASHGATALMLTTEGFVLTNGSSDARVGKGVIDDHFKSNVRANELKNVRIFYSRLLRSYVVSIPSRGGENETLTYFYNAEDNLWSTGTQEMLGVIYLKRPGWTVDQLADWVRPGATTVDELDVRIDSDVLAGGDVGVEHIWSNGNLQIFSGSTMEGQIDISGFNVGSSMRGADTDRNFMLAEVRPLTTGDVGVPDRDTGERVCACRVYATATSDLSRMPDVEDSDYQPINRRGYKKTRAKGRFIFAFFKFAANHPWDRFIGYEGVFRGLGTK